MDLMKLKILIESHNYLKYIFETEKIENINTYSYRNIFYDYYSDRGNLKKKYPDELKEIIDGWEIVIGRQYFTAGLEMIWKFMLECLNIPKTKENWFLTCIEESKFDFDINGKLEDIIKECNFSFEDREKIISNASSDSLSHESNIENGIKIILSVYNRFIDRDDFSKDNLYFYNYGSDRNSISFNNFFEIVKVYSTKSIKEFIIFIMNNYLLLQHFNTAFEKMIQGRDGYYVEKIENFYARKEFFKLDFQGLRMIQLTSVMKDLNILGE